MTFPHPLETSRLQGLGLTWKEAAQEDRLLRFMSAVCIACGHPAEMDIGNVPLPMIQPTLAQRIGDDMIGIVAAGIAVLLLVGYTEVDLWWRLVMLPGVVVVGLIFYWTVSARAARLLGRFRPAPEIPESTVACAYCPTGLVYPVESVVERPLPCPNCASLSYSYARIGVS